MQNIKTRFIYNTLFFFLVYILMLYVIIRAFTLVMTHDEAYSFHNVKRFWHVEALCTGNTHWFNFLAIKAAVLLGLEKVSQLRWFSLFSAGVFFTLVYFWIKSIKHIYIKIFAFSIALLNPYLLDYFSLARGYTSGLMFEALCILYFMLSLRNNNRMTVFLSLFFAGMSAIANFNFFYFFAAFSIVYFFTHYFKHGFSFYKEKKFYVDALFCIGIAAIVLRALLFITECSNDIGPYGGEVLVHALFYSFIDCLIYGKFVIPNAALSILGYGLFILIIFIALFGVINFKKHKSQLFLLVGSLLLLMLILCIMNKWCFHVLYPTYRTTLMFFPLFAIIVTEFTIHVVSSNKFTKLILYALSVLFIFNFATSINFKSTFDYPEQVDTKTGFIFLQNIHAKKVGIAPELYGVFVNYYQLTDKYNYSFKGESINTYRPLRQGIYKNKLEDYDYLMLFPPYDLSFYKHSKVRIEVLNIYPTTQTLIAKVIK